MAPPEIVTVTVPSGANLTVPLPAGSRTVNDAAVSRFVMTHVDGPTWLCIRTTLPFASKNVHCLPVPPETISNETANGHAIPAGYVPATDPPADPGPYGSWIGPVASAGAAVTLLASKTTKDAIVETSTRFILIPPRTSARNQATIVPLALSSSGRRPLTGRRSRPGGPSGRTNRLASRCRSRPRGTPTSPARWPLLAGRRVRYR